MSTTKRAAKPKASTLEAVNPMLAFGEALSGLQALTQLLASLRPPEGSMPGTTPTIVLTSAGVEIRMTEGLAPMKIAPAVSEAKLEAHQEMLQKIEEGLESVRQATAALAEAFTENAKNVDSTLTAHAAAIETVRTSLTQNEQLMESMVELMGPADFTLPNPDEFANIS
jgi:hypothetical protein